MITALILLASLAHAQDSLPSGVVPVPPGSEILLGGNSRLVPEQYWLLPDDYYRKALVSAKQLEICRPALEQITEDALAWQDRTYSALHECSEQFGRDEELVQQLTVQVMTSEAKNLLAIERQKKAQRVAIVSWAVSGALVLGLTSALLVSQ
jgi:hypothetical protein